MTIKILNLYAGIGGNRKLWTGDIEVTAVEYNEDIAKVYQDLYKDDKVIIGDAHEFLLNNYMNYDFIWASPPCPSHSRVRFMMSGENQQNKPIYPDMKLYEEIIFLTHYFKGKFVVENVISYYEPLIKPFELQRHHFWSNFVLTKKDFECDNVRNGNNIDRQDNLGFDLSKYNNIDKTKVLRNCVKPEVGKYILDMAFKTKQMLICDIK